MATAPVYHVVLEGNAALRRHCQKLTAELRLLGFRISSRMPASVEICRGMRLEDRQFTEFQRLVESAVLEASLLPVTVTLDAVDRFKDGRVIYLPVLGKEISQLFGSVNGQVQCCGFFGDFKAPWEPRVVVAELMEDPEATADAIPSTIDGALAAVRSFPNFKEAFTLDHLQIFVDDGMRCREVWQHQLAA